MRKDSKKGSTGSWNKSIYRENSKSNTVGCRRTELQKELTTGRSLWDLEKWKLIPEPPTITDNRLHPRSSSSGGGNRYKEGGGGKDVGQDFLDREQVWRE